MTLNVPRHQAHADVIAAMLRDDHEFAREYLHTALSEAEEPGGQTALLLALRHIAEAQGMTVISERAGVKRETL